MLGHCNVKLQKLVSHPSPSMTIYCGVCGLSSPLTWLSMFCSPSVDFTVLFCVAVLWLALASVLWGGLTLRCLTCTVQTVSLDCKLIWSLAGLRWKKWGSDKGWIAAKVESCGNRGFWWAMRSQKKWGEPGWLWPELPCSGTDTTTILQRVIVRFPAIKKET